MKIINIILILMLNFTFNINAAAAIERDKTMELSKNVCFEGIVISSITYAHEDFKKFGYDISKYTVSIEISKNITITFIPNFHPDEGMLLGGKTKYGRVVSYFMDRKSGEFLKKSFAR